MICLQQNLGNLLVLSAISASSLIPPNLKKISPPLPSWMSKFLSPSTQGGGRHYVSVLLPRPLSNVLFSNCSALFEAWCSNKIKQTEAVLAPPSFTKSSKMGQCAHCFENSIPSPLCETHFLNYHLHMSVNQERPHPKITSKFQKLLFWTPGLPNGIHSNRPC